MRWTSIARLYLGFLHRATGQHEQADELLERCLYALEMGLHPYCVLGDANCRIPCEFEKNRPLFTALFKHMQVGSQLAKVLCWQMMK